MRYVCRCKQIGKHLQFYRQNDIHRHCWDVRICAKFRIFEFDKGSILVATRSILVGQCENLRRFCLRCCRTCRSCSKTSCQYLTERRTELCHDMTIISPRSTGAAVNRTSVWLRWYINEFWLWLVTEEWDERYNEPNTQTQWILRLYSVISWCCSIVNILTCPPSHASCCVARKIETTEKSFTPVVGDFLYVLRFCINN